MATYLDNAGVTQILTKIKSLLAKKAEITAIPTKVSQLTNDRSYQTPDDVSTKISTSLGELDYDVKDEAEGSNQERDYLTDIIQTDGKIKAKRSNFIDAWEYAFRYSESKGDAIYESTVDSKIASAVGKITSFEYKVVSELPPESDGVKGTIYLLRHGGNDNTNSFDEYILVDTYTGADGVVYSAHYEKIGTTDIDLTPYAKKTEIPTKVSQLANDSEYGTAKQVDARIARAVSYLEYSDTAVTGQYVSAVSETNGVITVTRANLPAAGTADTPISNTTIENIFTQVFG